jgi:very-short-patch-repair endonuclease
MGGYIVDFVCLKKNLVIELDGGQHFDPEGVAYDTRRTRQLEELGLRVLRVSDNEMLKDPDAVLRTILREMEAEEPPPILRKLTEDRERGK